MISGTYTITYLMLIKKSNPTPTGPWSLFNKNPPTVVPQPMLQSDKEFEKQILASLNQNRVRAKNVSGIFINVFFNFN